MTAPIGILVFANPPGLRHPDTVQLIIVR